MEKLEPSGPPLDPPVSDPVERGTQTELEDLRKRTAAEVGRAEGPDDLQRSFVDERQALDENDVESPVSPAQRAAAEVRVKAEVYYFAEAKALAAAQNDPPDVDGEPSTQLSMDQAFGEQWRSDVPESERYTADAAVRVTWRARDEVLRASRIDIVDNGKEHPVRVRTEWSADQYEKRLPDMPQDDSGYCLKARDLAYLDIGHRQFDWWKEREAPLGMTPEQYRAFRSELQDALKGCGVKVDDVDARLQGSAAHLFSGNPKKKFPELRETVSKERGGQQELEAWFGPKSSWDPANQPRRIPFDARARLKRSRESDDLSDYDIQLSSDALVDLISAHAANGDEQDLFNDAFGGFVEDKYWEDLDALVPLYEWQEKWELILGRPVNPKIFPSRGPDKRSGSGFSDSDWRLF